MLPLIGIYCSPLLLTQHCCDYQQNILKYNNRLVASIHSKPKSAIRQVSKSHSWCFPAFLETYLLDVSTRVNKNCFDFYSLFFCNYWNSMQMCSSAMITNFYFISTYKLIRLTNNKSNKYSKGKAWLLFTFIHFVVITVLHWHMSHNVQFIAN